MSSILLPGEISARLRAFIMDTVSPVQEVSDFNTLAIEIFKFQIENNSAYRRFCLAKGITAVKDWIEIPPMPAAAFKEFEVTCIAAEQQNEVYHSSGTTTQVPSKHFHCADSLALYDLSLITWFRRWYGAGNAGRRQFLFLTPGPGEARHSSLAHMFEVIRRELGSPDSLYLGRRSPRGDWVLNADQAIKALREAANREVAVNVFGTAYLFVHLLDALKGESVKLPWGSMVFETGGYKGRSGAIPREQMYDLIEERLGIERRMILREYGMSELSSQAYCWAESAGGFSFPPWARAEIVSPETGQPVAVGEVGLVRVYDLANLYSVTAVQTEDLAMRMTKGFELVGRAEHAEPRGCSLMSTDSLALNPL